MNPGYRFDAVFKTSSQMRSLSPALVFCCFCLQDILNNLESCDLEDDDLMLDVDLPEDAPLDNGELEQY